MPGSSWERGKVSDDLLSLAILSSSKIEGRSRDTNDEYVGQQMLQAVTLVTEKITKALAVEFEKLECSIASNPYLAGWLGCLGHKSCGTAADRCSSQWTLMTSCADTQYLNSPASRPAVCQGKVDSISHAQGSLFARDAF